jgi:hypothetical protein
MNKRVLGWVIFFAIIIGLNVASYLLKWNFWFY